MALQVGDMLQGRYRILSVLGQGGMGSVYRALDTTLNIEVAIKENLFGSAEYAEQFKQEARLLASLRHPNLPRVTDYFVIENQGQYLVMDYIEGEDLKARIERTGKISVREAVTIGLALCDALEYLHNQQPPIIHRDIKPGNVRITSEGHVFLVDFGLAKIGGHDQRTVTGAQAVTPGFSPPEQYGTAHTGPHSDIYSLGATLYMALAGEAPPDAFERALDQAELRPLDAVNPEVPAALAQIIETAMALQASDRFTSAAEMKAALLSLDLVPNQEQHLQDHQWVISPPPGIGGWRSAPADGGSGKPPSQPPTAASGAAPGSQPRPAGAPAPAGTTPSRPHKRYRRLRIWLWLSLIALVLAAWYRVSPHTLQATALQVERWGQTRLAPYAARLMPGWQPITPPPSTAPPTALAGTVITPQAVAAHTTFTPTPPPTATPTPTITPTPAPTPLGGSGQLAFASQNGDEAQIWLTDTTGRLIRQLTERPGGACQPAWAPDGNALAFTAPCKTNQSVYLESQIYLLHLDSGKVDELTPPEWGGYDPAISPDGHWLAFTSLHSGSPQLYLLNLSTHKITPLTPNIPQTAQPSWSPDGHFLAFTSLETSRIWLLPFDPATGKTGEPQPFSHSGSKLDTHPTWGGDGALLIFSQLPSKQALPYLVKAPLAQKGLQEFPLTVIGIAMREPAASPDGRWLAFEGWESPNHDIFLLSIDGAQVKRLTTRKGWDFDPAWRPSLP